MDLDFYEGFEGEPEIVVTRHLGESRVMSIRMWVGDFDHIVGRIPPGPTGWRGFTMPYHLHTGWYDEDCWFDPDIPGTLELLEDVADLIRDEDRPHAILCTWCDLLREALATGGRVSIEYD